MMVGCICLLVLLSLLLCHNDDVNLNRQVKQWLLVAGYILLVVVAIVLLTMHG